MTTHDREPGGAGIGRRGPTDSPDYPPLMAGVLLLCALGAAGSVWPSLDRVLGFGIAGGLVLGVLAVAGRLLVRWLRERAEDRADLAEAAGWRAAHRLPAAGTGRCPSAGPSVPARPVRTVRTVARRGAR